MNSEEEGGPWGKHGFPHAYERVADCNKAIDPAGCGPGNEHLEGQAHAQSLGR
jgi:hypothetical protein